MPPQFTRHYAAQDAGQFAPFYHSRPLMSPHPLPIVTNARKGLPVSLTNRKRRRSHHRLVAAGLALALVVAGLAALFLF